MNNANQSPQAGTKNITLSFVFAWIVGSVLLLSGIIGIFSNPIVGISCLLASVLILPPAYKLASEKSRMNLSKGLRILVALVFLVGAGALAGSNKTPVSDNPQPAPVAVTAAENNPAAAPVKTSKTVAKAPAKASVPPTVPAQSAPVSQPLQPATPPKPSVPSFGNGDFVVGTDIQPGTYRTRTGSSGCYYSRLSGFGGSIGDIISNENTDAPAIVTIAASDKGFKSVNCSTWTQDLSQITSSQTSFGDGTFIIGTDIQAGTYKNTGRDGCYYSRLSGFGGSIGDIIANENTDTSAIISIAPTDRGFKSVHCGTWSKLN